MGPGFQGDCKRRQYLLSCPPCQLLYLRNAISHFPLPLSPFLFLSGNAQEHFPERTRKPQPTTVSLCKYLEQLLSSAFPVTLFINCKARATGCDSVARINFIDVNKLRGGLIRTLNMTAILGQVYISLLNGHWLTPPFPGSAP